MGRVTKADLEQLVEVVKTTTDDNGYYVEYAYGQPRLYHETGASRGTREVSPRLSARELSYWLEGFIEGLDAPLGCDIEEEEDYE
jgi:hypothetical protein